MGFLTNLFGASSSTVTGVATSDVTRSITQSCNTGSTNSVETENVSIKVSNIDCKDINLVVQSTNTNMKCVEKATLYHVAANLQAQLHSAAKQAKKPVSASLFGVTFSSTDIDIHKKLTEAIKQKCGDNDTAASVYNDITMNLQNVQCSSLNVLTQQSSFSSICSLQGTADALKKNTALAQAPVPGQTTHLDLVDAAAFIGGVVLLVIVAVVVAARYVLRLQSDRIHREAKRQLGYRPTPPTTSVQ